MMKDFKLLRPNSERREEAENVPVNIKDSTTAVKTSRTSSESSSRLPFNPIQDPVQNPRPEQDSGAIRSKVERTPTKASKARKASDLSTPERPGTAVSARKRFGWAQRNLDSGDFHEIGALPSLTPRIGRNVVKGGLSYSESGSTNTTPNKSVSKPPSSVFRGKADGGRGGNFAALYKGVPISSGPCTTVVNSVEVPHFDLKEDSSFWMEHNVQVLIRVRPLNNMELNTHGYNRCLKQENAQTITWIGQPETRFTFDHVACETVDQDMLFRMAGLPMVENCLSGYNSCMFAYGQTGSGKTHTMLGEIDDLENKPSPNRGMTPRIFEFLFARIQVEEETRKDEKLKYSCKCSFLEIYNEQITDLLDPSSSNLLLREDVTKGVYVENLSEFEVHTVSDILRLLIQGSSNRRVAATNMNRESSRSHSVFTCVIESRWEKDSATNFRFARLNLVDLAGSERQKTSGAEGERLKEAANINKSLSTLGHVIMVLVDMAHGKIKHIPYRDSRLTFLLQDSLGGNSKTMIISNVSPSIGSAAETLNTLKFAQRAKLIQNNAVVNEDSTGDCIALQHQIRLLKEELYILKHPRVSRSLSYCSTDVEDSQVQNGNICDMDLQCQDDPFDEKEGTVRLSSKQLKSVEKTLAGALRREKIAEATIKQLEAEKEQLNRLVCQREDETRSSKMMLRFREDKIKKMEALIAGSIHPEAYLLDENRALCDEIQLLQAKLDKNPQVTRFAYENIRLLNQLRRLEEYYEEGERDLLLDDVSKLRDQLLQFLDGPLKQQSDPNYTMEPQLKETCKELDECRHSLIACLEDNAKLNRDIDDLHKMLNTLRSTPIVDNGDLNSKVQNVHIQETAREHAEEVLSLQLELDIVNIILKEERTSHDEIVSFLNRDLQLANEEFSRKCKQHDEDTIKLQEANCIIADLETQKIMSHNAIEDLRKSNSRYMQLLSKQELALRALKEQSTSKEFNNLQRLSFANNHDSPLQEKLKRMQESLEVAKRMNMSYQTDRAFQVSNEEEVEEVRRQAEAETAEVIVCMQEELSILQQQVQDSVSKELEVNKNVLMLENELEVVQQSLHNLNIDNEMLRKQLQEKDAEIRTLSEEWTLLCCDIEGVLSGGYEVLVDASEELALMSNSLPEKRTWISEQVGRVVQMALEKESLIEELGTCLEDANHKRSDVECMLKSLKGATLALTEAHQQEYTEKVKELLVLRTQLKTETSTVEKLGNKVKLLEDQIKNTSLAATVAFVVVNTFAEMNRNNLDALEHNSVQLKEAEEFIAMKVSHLNDLAIVIEEAESRNQSLNEDFAECKKTCEILRIKVEGIDRENILKTKEKLAELQTGVSTLRSGMNPHLEHHPSSIPNPRVPCKNSEGEGGGQMATGIVQDHSQSKQDLEYRSCNTIEKSIKECGTDVTIILLKKEIEAALDSLKEVQAEMGNLREENKLMCKAESQSRDGMNVIGLQVVNLQSTFNEVEVQSKVKLEALNLRLQAFEQIVQETRSHWCQREELIELEVDDVKLVAAQKSAEAACVLAKYEEAQDTMKEADIMINELLVSNQNMKLEIEILKNQEASLNTDRDSLLIEVQSLQSINDISNQKLEHLEGMRTADVMQMKDVVLELEDMLAGIQAAYKETFMLLSSDICSVKSLLAEPSKFVHSFLEDISAEIIMKECAVSVLHLCHIGSFQETVTRLYVENGLLQHQLCESNNVVADLRQHNNRSERELDMYQILKEKLLADIKTGFARISRKEEEIGKLYMKVTAFEKQISELQIQEEFMLQTSNRIRSQLDNVLKEVDLTTSNIGASLLDQERLHKKKEVEIESQVECLILDWSTKAFESLVLASKLEEMATQKADLERENIEYSARMEDFMNEVVILQVHSNIKEQLLLDEEVEVACLQKKSKEEREDLLLQLNLSNDSLKGELDEVKKSEVRLLNQVHVLGAEYQELREDLSIKARNLELFSSQISALDEKNLNLQDDIHMLHTWSHGIQDALKKKDDELSRMSFLEIENVLLKCEVQRFEMESDTLKQENVLFREQLMCLKKIREDFLSMWSVTVKSCAESMETADLLGERLCNIIKQDGAMILERMSDEIFDTVDRVIEQFACLECQTEGVVSENLSLQAELLRKDEVLKGLLFDLTLLKESASKNKDQQDEIKEVVASLGALEVELSEKSCELDEANSNIQILETQLQEKNDFISRLNLSLSQKQESLNGLSTENGELKARIEGATAAHDSALKELTEKKTIIESLKIEVVEMSNALGQMNDSNESLRNNLNELARERDHLHFKMDHLQKNLEREQARADEFEVNANENHLIAELRKNYADDKEAEVKLLEQSIEELERTVNMLENKVDMVKDEAERQRLHGEELESELQAIKHQMLNVENANAEISRHLDEKEKSIQEAQWNIQVLERDITQKNAEIAQYQAHISELNLHAEAQACEYKQKFKALESMAEQVKPEGHSTHATSTAPNKTEKYATRARGSGSPFKCIGLGLAQQVKSEKDEELVAARTRIEELESLALSRQKEIFNLNSRIASADSMTHDVLRDLLGIKLDMTTYASLLDNQQVQKITEKARLHSFESKEKEQEVVKLKNQLNEFIEERRGWLEEIERKQAETIAAQIALEKLRQRGQLHRTENEVLKMENANHKKKVMELEGEVDKLSGQQNIQQRIHHHAKIKEENHMLKSHNEELGTKLQRTEVLLSRCKEELARYRASFGRNPYVDFDEEQRLNTKVKEIKEEKMQLAQELLGLCTSVLKAAGITKHIPHINPSIAEEAVEQLKNKIKSLDRELQDLKVKNKITSERLRLSELMLPASPESSKPDENCHTPRRMSQAPYFSAPDR